MQCVMALIPTNAAWRSGKQNLQTQNRQLSYKSSKIPRIIGSKGKALSRVVPTDKTDNKNTLSGQVVLIVLKYKLGTQL
jgi:hypothetical protein